MKVVAARSIRLEIPFADGGRGEGMTPSAWNRFDMVLVRIVTEDGLVGWGEAFSYFCAGGVQAMLEDTVLPMLLGRDVSDPAVVSDFLQRRLTLFGRYGITIFALSGIDIALWDIKGKREGKSLGELIGSRVRDRVEAYASLVRYGDSDTAARYTRRAADEGFRYIKLHETREIDIEACRIAARDARLMVDVNCGWSLAEARHMAGWLGKRDFFWLEEPTFPPEDFAQLQHLPRSVDLSGGENLCTAWQFEQLLDSGRVRYPQPSVTKVGGISEFIKIMALADGRDGVSIMPHSPYFGPGYVATLQICAALRHDPLLEYLYVWPDGSIYPDLPQPVGGVVAVPTGPGLGMDPDPSAIERFLVR